MTILEKRGLRAQQQSSKASQQVSQTVPSVQTDPVVPTVQTVSAVPVASSPVYQTPVADANQYQTVQPVITQPVVQQPVVATPLSVIAPHSDVQKQYTVIIDPIVEEEEPVLTTVSNEEYDYDTPYIIAVADQDAM